MITDPKKDAITVAELIAHLKTLPPDLLVVFSRHSEWEGLQPHNLTVAKLANKGGWFGEAYTGAEKRKAIPVLELP